MLRRRIISELKHQIKALRHRPQKRFSFGTLFGVISVVLYFSYYAGLKSAQVPDNPQPAHQCQVDVDALQQEVSYLKEQLSVERNNYQIQFEAQKNLSQHLKALEDQNTELSRDVALYERIRGVSSSPAIDVKSFHVFDTSGDNKYRYLLILSKDAQPEKVVQGTVQMTIQGRMGEEAIRLPVRYADAQSPGLAFKFRSMQELTGELRFPEGFVPESVVFDVKPVASAALQREFPWENS